MPSYAQRMFDLTGKVALITGGGSGIGLAIAKAYVESGARVLVGSRTVEKIEGAVKELNAAAKAPAPGDDPVAAGVALDVTTDGSAEHAARKAMDLYGRLDILVNCAGIILRKPTFELKTEDFNNIYNTHVTGSLRCAQACGHLFREQHSGCIINIASISSFVDLIEVAAYASAKNAVMGLTRSLANEWAKYGIRVNAIAPGVVETDFNRKLIHDTPRGQWLKAHTPLDRFGTGEDMVGAAIYLISPAASFTTGETIVIDGGFLARGVGISGGH